MRGLKNRLQGAVFFLLTWASFFPSPALAEGRFTVNGNGTVTDNATDLTWIQNPDNVAEIASGMMWLQAKDVCRELVYGGFGPRIWHMPNINELKSIVDHDLSGQPKIDTTVFKANHGQFWSSTSVLAQMSKAYTIDFTTGELRKHPKLNLINPSRLRVRCVRN